MTDKALASNFKSFVSETEIEEKRQKRQEEWEKVRQPGQSIEAPEEAVNNQTLYERLQQQKDKKQEEYDESHKLKNRIRGLDNDEAEFLAYVSDRQSEILVERYQEEVEMLSDFKKATTDAVKPAKRISCKNASLKVLTKPTKSPSQSQLLCGAIKRKQSEEDKDIDIQCSKLGKASEVESKISPHQPPNIHEETIISAKINNEVKINKEDIALIIRNEDVEAKMIGYLPGIGNYSEDSEDSDESSSSSEVEIKTLFPPIVRIKDVQKAMNQGNH